MSALALTNRSFRMHVTLQELDLSRAISTDGKCVLRCGARVGSHSPFARVKNMKMDGGTGEEALDLLGRG